MRRILREIEVDKINRELFNEIYPMEALTNYYNFGVATMLDALDEILEKNSDSFTREDFKYMINHYAKMNSKVNEYFNRLKKDRQ